MSKQSNEMTASDRLAQELTIATDASIGVIIVRCPETEVYNVVDEIYALAQSDQQRTQFRLHTTDKGWQEFDNIDPQDDRAEPFDPLKPKGNDKVSATVAKAFETLHADTMPSDGFFVMLDLYFNFPEMVTQTNIRKTVQRSLNNGQRLFLIVPNTAEIPEAISALSHIIDYGYPSREELNTSLDDILDGLVPEDAEDDERMTLTDDDRSAIISNGQGMTSHAFETAVALSITEYSVKYDNLDEFSAQHIVDSLRTYKTQLLQKTNVLELQQPVSENDIGGLDLFKEWMHQRKMTYTEDALDHGVTPSRGALVVGPPGTGKSLVAKAAGSILNLPVIRFDVGKVFGQYIGQSEQSMRAVLQLLDAMAPCVLMLDEIDKGFSGVTGSTDSGTTSRVFGTFLTWMQERDQRNRPVFLIMTANRVEGLPPELLRRGRIDETWSVNVPNAEEREAIISIHASKRKQELDVRDMKAAVRITEGFVGAEIEAVIEDALVMSLSEDEPGINYDLIEKAKDYLKPMSETRKDEFDAMKKWASNNARASSSGMQQSAKADTPKRGRVKVKKPKPAKIVRK